MPAPKETARAEDYWNLPEGVRAELIDDQLVNLVAPSRIHQRIVFQLARRLEDHVREQGGNCQVNVAPFAVNLFANESTFVEPDVTVVCDPVKLSDRGCEGAPDLVVEVVSPSSVNMDYFTKLALYREAGVREYWVVDPMNERTLVYAFDAGTNPLGIYHFAAPALSFILTGFSVDVGAIVAEV